MKRKQLKVPRGTARRLRRESAKRVYSGHNFRLYWNRGNPTADSLKRAKDADQGDAHQ